MGVAMAFYVAYAIMLGESRDMLPWINKTK